MLRKHRPAVRVVDLIGPREIRYIAQFTVRSRIRHFHIGIVDVSARLIPVETVISVSIARADHLFPGGRVCVCLAVVHCQHLGVRLEGQLGILQDRFSASSLIAHVVDAPGGVDQHIRHLIQRKLCFLLYVDIIVCTGVALRAHHHKAAHSKRYDRHDGYRYDQFDDRKSFLISFHNSSSPTTAHCLFPDKPLCAAGSYFSQRSFSSVFPVSRISFSSYSL